MHKVFLTLTTAAFSIFIVAIVSVLAAVPMYWLWNWLMPVLFSLTTITFWQAWGLVFLTSILFKRTNSS